MAKRLALGLLFLLACVALGYGAGKLRAEPRCAPVDPASLIWTGYGFSVAMGDGQVWVHRDDVHYDEVAQPMLCMPAKGMLELLLPHAWPSYAADHQPAWSLREPVPSVVNASGRHLVLLARTVFTAMRRSAAAAGILLAHQKLASASGVALVHDFYTPWMQPPRPGVSCCSNQDCEPVEARYDEKRGLYQAYIEGEWRDIDPSIVLDPKKPENANPDGSFHACWDRSTKRLLCFREAEPKI